MDSRSSPFAAFHFIIEFDGMKAGFSEVEGLPTETEARKVPGKPKYTNLSLKRGYSNTKELREWHKSVKAGNTPRLSGREWDDVQRIFRDRSQLRGMNRCRKIPPSD